MENIKSLLQAARQAHAGDNHQQPGPRKKTAAATLDALDALAALVETETARQASENAALQDRIVKLEAAAVVPPAPVPTE